MLKKFEKIFMNLGLAQVPLFCSRAKTARRQNDPNPMTICVIIISIIEFEKKARWQIQYKQDTI